MVNLTEQEEREYLDATRGALKAGLEFGHVAVPGVDALNYADETEQRLLYIACTRAQHSLTLLHTGDVTSLIS